MSQKHEHSHPHSYEAKELATLVLEQARLLAEEKKVDTKLFWIAVYSAAVAILATGAAIWSAYEAHMSRKEGIDITTKAFYQDERPYMWPNKAYLDISIAPLRSIDSSAFSNPKGWVWVYDTPAIYAVFKSYGRSPAINIEIDSVCQASKMGHPPTHFRTTEETTTIAPFLTPNDVIMTSCDQAIFTNKNEDSFIEMRGIVHYHDFQGNSYQTPFCWETFWMPRIKDNLKNGVTPCTPEGQLK